MVFFSSLSKYSQFWWYLIFDCRIFLKIYKSVSVYEKYALCCCECVLCSLVSKSFWNLVDATIVCCVWFLEPVVLQRFVKPYLNYCNKYVEVKCHINIILTVIFLIFFFASFYAWFNFSKWIQFCYVVMWWSRTSHASPKWQLNAQQKIDEWIESMKTEMHCQNENVKCMCR